MAIKNNAKKLYILFSLCLCASITNMHAMLDLQLDKKPDNYSVYRYCINISHENLQKKIKDLLHLLGVDWQTFEQKRNEINQNGVDLTNPGTVAMPDNLKKAIDTVKDYPALRNTLGIQSVRYEDNTAFITAKYKAPITISHNYFAATPKKISQTFPRRIVLDYEQINNAPEMAPRITLRKTFAKLVNLSYETQRTLYLLCKEIKQVDQKQKDLLWRNYIAAKTSMNIITSIFDDLNALQELMISLSQKQSETNRKILETLEEIKTALTIEKLFMNFDPEDREKQVTLTQLLKEHKNPSWLKQLEQLTKTHKQSIALYNEAIKATNQNNNKAIQNLRQIINTNKHYHFKNMLEYYIKAKCNLGILLLDSQTPKSLNKASILEALTLLREVENQRYNNEKRLRAKYKLFILYLNGFHTVPENKTLAGQYFNYLVHQHHNKIIRAKALYLMGSKLINQCNKQPNTTNQKDRELGYQFLTPAMEQNDCMQTKIRAIRALLLSNNKQAKLKAIKIGYETCQYLFTKEQNQHQAIHLASFLLSDPVFTAQKSETDNLLQNIYSTARSSRSSSIKVLALNKLIFQSANGKHIGLAVTQGAKLMHTLYEYNKIESCTNLIRCLVEQTVNPKVRQEAYKLLHKIIFNIDNEQQKKSLIHVYFNLAVNVLSKDTQSGMTLLEKPSSQSLIPQVKQKAATILNRAKQQVSPTKKRGRKRKRTPETSAAKSPDLHFTMGSANLQRGSGKPSSQSNLPGDGQQPPRKKRKLSHTQAPQVLQTLTKQQPRPAQTKPQTQPIRNLLNPQQVNTTLRLKKEQLLNQLTQQAQIAFPGQPILQQQYMLLQLHPRQPQPMLQQHNDFTQPIGLIVATGKKPAPPLIHIPAPPQPPSAIDLVNLQNRMRKQPVPPNMRTITAPKVSVQAPQISSQFQPVYPFFPHQHIQSQHLKPRPAAPITQEEQSQLSQRQKKLLIKSTAIQELQKKQKQQGKPRKSKKKK